MGTKIAAIAALIGFSVLPVFAQSRGGGGHAAAMRSSGGSRPMRTAPVSVRPIPGSHTSRNANSGINGFTNGGFSNGTIQDLFGYPTPGLGFDFTHLAAVNGNLGVQALIDPVTQGEIALALRLRGVNGGVSPFLYSGYGGYPIVMESPVASAAPDAAPQQQQQQPIIVVAQQPAGAVQPVAEVQPLPDPGEFVLVQRDGRLLFAVAFTAQPGGVVYVTKEGLRRSISLDQLDVDTTLRMNEERGSSIQLPTQVAKAS
jgi:hypothetical protein